MITNLPLLHSVHKELNIQNLRGSKKLQKTIFALENNCRNQFIPIKHRRVILIQSLIFVLKFNNSEGNFMKFLRLTSFFVRCDALRKVMEKHSKSASDTVCNVNYTQKHGTPSSCHL